MVFNTANINYDNLMNQYLEIKEQNASLIAELKRYREAEAEGRLIELPCKVGDMVYHLSRENKLIDELLVMCVGVVAWHHKKGEANIPYSDFGKTIFLDRATAEARKEQEE